MKKIYLLFLIVITSLFKAQIITFPDSNFKAKLLSANTTNGIAKNDAGQNIVIDVNQNGEIENTEASQVYRLDFSGITITNITGISSFSNLKVLKVAELSISNLNISSLTNLQTLRLFNLNSITSLSIANFPNLVHLQIIGLYNLNSLSLQNLNLLNELTVTNNITLTNQSFSNLPSLVYLNVYSNNLSNLTVTNCPLLQEISASNNNNLSLLTLTTVPSLKTILVNNDNLTNLNLSALPQLQTISAINNDLISIDLSQNPIISSVYLSNNNLQTVNIKNGGQSFPGDFFLENNPLVYLCCDTEDQQLARSNLDADGLYTATVNTYCSFIPGGTVYTIQGNTKYDSNNNDCDANDQNKALQKFNIANGTTSGSIIANNSGNYSIPVQAGTHAITPILENPAYFNISPASFTANLPAMTSPLTQNFCLTANGNHNDLEVLIIPITAAAPGFNAKYKIVYKNKGTASQSGTLVYNFNDNLMNFLTSTLAPNAQTTGVLNWNFSNLLPFESREITVTFTLNMPTQNPPLLGGNILNYSSQINGATDETPTDNLITLNQTVVNSFDPNDKTCLEGATISPSQVGNYVHYLIRFENTGTANAQNIVVKDDIDLSKFDLSTLVPLNGSHNFVTRITGSNTVEFIFENIQLPFLDAANDGYVTFKIKTKANLVLGSTFSNTAKIYFDYNAPIFTNTYATTVQNLLATNETVKKDQSFSIFPNPAHDVLQIRSKEKIVKTEIYDVAGRILKTSVSDNEEIDVSDLPNGDYLIKIFTKDKISTEKFIKN
ncbi:hypothetical protein ASG01_10010 [Chryseobacterium sp. Leaf180]|uniref:T9SS type A sorting domain-containing protein n=1 Tax=Chryseobacterium sp. Leaf180 TaxID=1736289 RepID=UPI0006F5C50A|nr:T9SS type A sorting domain-containing protein [Chryseobacterium sp. Leaf180]KQR93499.1 hypothetical protein ASG01_10010 [Chryseobacterium sp. Leaf180]